MSFNRTNSTNITPYISSDEEDHKPASMYVFYSIEVFIIVTGTILNLWFLVAILTSQDLRSRLRNKIFCNILILHLLDCVLIIPASIGATLSGQKFSCVIQSALENIELIPDFIANWLVVIMIVVFIAQIMNFNPSLNFVPRTTTICTIGLLVFPWVASLIVVPVIIYEYYHSLAYAQKGCSYPTQAAIQLFKSLDTAVPIPLAIILVAAAATLRYRRFNRGCASGSMQIELLDEGPEIDKTHAYVTAVILSTVCDLLRLIFSLDMFAFLKFGMDVWYNLSITAWLLSDARVVLLALPWLFLTDIRQRIKIWRPWRRSTPGIDLTVAYRKEEN